MKSAARFTLFGAAIGVMSHGMIVLLVLILAADAADAAAYWTRAFPVMLGIFAAYLVAVVVSYRSGRRRLALVVACGPFPALIVAFAVAGLFR